MARSQRDLPTQSADANCFPIDHGDVVDFTKGILSCWKSHASEVGAWREAARIAFAMAPYSAEAKRVCSFLKILLERNKDIAPSDYIRGSMILRCSNTNCANKAHK
jgi:hypothetical protein